jgi:hypothetical protein
MRSVCPGVMTPDQLSLGAITASCRVLLKGRGPKPRVCYQHAAGVSTSASC